MEKLDIRETRVLPWRHLPYRGDWRCSYYGNDFNGGKLRHAADMLNCPALPRKRQMTVVLNLGTFVAMDTDEFPEEAPDDLDHLRPPFYYTVYAYATELTDSLNLFLNYGDGSSRSKA